MITIGISGVARSGKDHLGMILCDYFESIGLNAKKFSFARELKNDLDEFLTSNFGISSFTEDDSEKSIIRPILIAYGQAKRVQSNGTFWIQKLYENIKSSGVDVAIITDVRFSDNKYDEPEFIQDTLNGSIIHLTRVNDDGSTVQPVCEDEARNNPKIHQVADLHLTWENIPIADARNQVRYFMDSTVDIWNR